MSIKIKEPTVEKMQDGTAKLVELMKGSDEDSIKARSIHDRIIKDVKESFSEEQIDLFIATGYSLIALNIAEVEVLDDAISNFEDMLS